ncbi:MAG: polymer-forming cytoskeletal protein [Trueperaceae bacterium]|nr:polymer-forming cytoskeletal protein [Trueperaceae bacterium]
MFKRGQDKQSASQTQTEEWTLINRQTVIEGVLKAQGRVRIHGKIIGDVLVNGVLEVAEEGVIEGTHVKADDIKIIGRVKANIEANGKIEIWQTGQLEGDVRARALEIDEGAMFIGRSDMRPKEKAVATLAASNTLKAAKVTEAKD